MRPTVASGTRVAANDGATRKRDLVRNLNDEIRRLTASFAADTELTVVCECAQTHCFARLVVSPDVYEDVRGCARRFVCKPDHVGTDERIVHEAARYAIVECAARD